MRGITKSFGSNNVLFDIDLDLNEGEVLALLGENGAGKSTLMNILGGVHKLDEGTIIINGETVRFEGPKDSLNRGIAFIHQELNLINDLTVYENMFLGNEILKRGYLLDQEMMIQKTNQVFERFDLDLKPTDIVDSLDASYKQIVEIARALLMDAKYIIMDEPTTSLTPVEIERVFSMMKNLKSHGVGIIFISHKLDEVMQFCDRFVVLRNGKLVASDCVENTTPREIAKYMVGHDVRSDVISRDINLGEVMLSVENLTDFHHFKDISFNVRSGEVLGVTGLLGDGRSEVFRTIFGDETHYEGNILMNGKQIKINGIKDAIKQGIAYIPSNRKENGIIPDLDILENGTLVSLNDYNDRFKGISKQRQLSAFTEFKEKLKLKMEKTSDLITSLSGGNQQKVVLTKWLLNKPKLLILDNPTQGVDVGSKEEIYDIIHDLASQGVAIVLLSNEPQEIIRTCDRAFVMYHGTIAGYCERNEMNEHEIMHLATGASKGVEI